MQTPEQSWRLNERHYGQLQNQKKSAVVEKYGAEQVLVWRRGYDVPPPLVCSERANAIDAAIEDYLQKRPGTPERVGQALRAQYHSFAPVQAQLDYLRAQGLFEDLAEAEFSTFCSGLEALFKKETLSEAQKTLLDQDREFHAVRGESLKDAMLRMKKWFRLEYLLWSEGEAVLIVAHGNWLRGVIKMLDHLTNEQVLAYNIPTASPILYDLQGLGVLRKRYLEEEKRLKAREQMVLDQVK